MNTLGVGMSGCDTGDKSDPSYSRGPVLTQSKRTLIVRVPREERGRAKTLGWTVPSLPDQFRRLSLAWSSSQAEVSPSPLDLGLLDPRGRSVP